MKSRAGRLKSRFSMKKCSLPLWLALLAPALAWAAPNPKLVMPELAGLSQKASESATITLDPALLAMAGRFLDGNDPQDAASKEIIKGLGGTYVRSNTFDKDSPYKQA